jgi:hypothetical protein
MIEIKWGGIGLEQTYMDLLAKKWIVGMCCALFFVVGSFLSIYHAVQGNFGTRYYLIFLASLSCLLCMSIILAFINKRIRSIECFLGFYEHRYEVRHQVFCTNHFHCIGLHYFKSFDTPQDEDLNERIP